MIRSKFVNKRWLKSIGFRRCLGKYRLNGVVFDPASNTIADELGRNALKAPQDKCGFLRALVDNYQEKLGDRRVRLLIRAAEKVGRVYYVCDLTECVLYHRGDSFPQEYEKMKMWQDARPQNRIGIMGEVDFARWSAELGDKLTRI